MFVANRVEIIRENSCDSQWFYVDTKANPADYCSRGTDVNNAKATETWFNGPSFLWESESTWASNRRVFDVSFDDPELKKELRTNYTEVAFDILHQLEEKISTWDRMKRVMSWVLRFKQILLRKIEMDAVKEPLHGSDLLQESEVQLIKFVQEKRFSAELKALRRRNKDVTMPRSSKIKQLDPFLNRNDIICVGGRLRRSFLNELKKQPIILPKGEEVSNLIIQHCHIRCAHGGRGATLNELRSSGYCITSCNAAVRSLLFKCVKCRRPRGRPGEQKMADLPVHRLAEAPPFTCCGVNMFGPFVTNQ